jgi:hypothetical protein
MSDELRATATGYRITVKDMHEWAAWGADYYAYDLDKDKLTQDYFGMSEEDAYKEFDDEHGCARSNVEITPIYVCSEDGQEIAGVPFVWSSHFFHNEDCFYSWDASMTSKYHDKYS